MQLPLGHVDAASGVSELFTVLSICETCVVGILMCNGAVVDLFGTSIADIRSLVQAITAFFFEVFAGLIAGRAGCALLFWRHIAHSEAAFFVGREVRRYGLLYLACGCPLCSAQQ